MSGFHSPGMSSNAIPPPARPFMASSKHSAAVHPVDRIPNRYQLVGSCSRLEKLGSGLVPVDVGHVLVRSILFCVGQHHRTQNYTIDAREPISQRERDVSGAGSELEQPSTAVEREMHANCLVQCPWIVRPVARVVVLCACEHLVRIHEPNTSSTGCSRLRSDETTTSGTPAARISSARSCAAAGSMSAWFTRTW